jgi:hypothetical protein
MLYLIDYDRESGTLISIAEFLPEQQSQAEKARLDLEVVLNAQGTDREIVLLEARDQASLRATHRRYFEAVKQLSVPAGHL